MKKIKILLAEDDLNLGTILKDFLIVKGFEVVHCLDGMAALAEFNINCCDFIILDVMMPKLDGFTFAKEIRKKNSFIPIIFLTAKSMLEDKIEGLKIGADNYITKPFSTEELLLRINAILKRVETQNGKLNKSSAAVYKIGKYIFDYNKRILLFKDNFQKLTSKEAELLRMLCLSKNQVLERSQALLNVWNDDTYFNARSMDVYIVKLRKYLKSDASVEIANVHGTGFKLID